MNLKRKESIRKEKENKKLSKWWLLLLIQLSRIKKNKLDLKIKKCSSILKINLRNKNKTNNVKPENKMNKKNKWENILQDKLKIKNSKKLKRKKLIKNKPKFGKKTLKTFSIMKKIRLITWKMFTSNIKAFWKNKWKTSKIRKTERKWTLWNYFTTRLLWKKLLDKIKTLKKQRFERIKLVWFLKLYFLTSFLLSCLMRYIIFMPFLID